MTSLSYECDALGDLKMATSSGADGRVNQVERHYNGLGQLEREGQYQSLDGGKATYAKWPVGKL